MFSRQNLYKFYIRILASGTTQLHFVEVEVCLWQVYLEAFIQDVLVYVSINVEWLPCNPQTLPSDKIEISGDITNCSWGPTGWWFPLEC